MEESTYSLELEVEFLLCLPFVMTFSKAFALYNWSFFICDNVRIHLRVVRLSYMTLPSIVPDSVDITLLFFSFDFFLCDKYSVFPMDGESFYLF